MKAYFLTVFTVAACLLSACSCNNQEDPQKKEEEPAIKGRYGADLSFEGKILNHKVQYSILLPKDYDKALDKSYPVVYLLHGFGDNNKSWNGQWLLFNMMEAELEADGLGDMIYVFPYGLNSYWCNRYNGKYNYMDMFVDEFIPYIDKTYRTIPDREHRSVTGYSMGGFGAMAMAERHPETFLCSAPLSMSFRTDSQYITEGPQSGWDNQWGSIFGGVGCTGENRLTDYYKQHCPFYQFVPEKLSALSKVHWYITCGDDEEQLLIANDALHMQMRDYGFEHEYRVGDGGHEGKYWRSALREVLPMFYYYMNGGQRWQGDVKAPQVEPVSFAADGSYLSASFSGEGQALFFVYDSSETEAALVQKVMSLVASSYGSGASFACLPCDLSVKSFDEWTAGYRGRYSFTSERAWASGAAGASVLGRNMKSLCLVEASVPADFKLEKSTSYYFACTDDSASYKDMGRLYKACKEGGAAFEYRVLDAAEVRADNILRCTDSLIKYFIQ